MAERFRHVLLLALAAASLPLQPAAAGPPAITAAEGLVLEPAAAEGLVRYPMFAALDDRGRLLVAESSGLDLYAEISTKTRRCRVIRLEDRDGDGRYETRMLFADRLVFPMGIACRDGRV